MLNEVSQSRKGQILRFHLHEVSKLIKFIEIDSRMVVTRDGGSGEG